MEETQVTKGQKVRSLTSTDRLKDMVVATPRQRVSMVRDAQNAVIPLTLTGSWQAVPLGTFTSRDVNTFPTNRYDATNNLIKANPSTTYEQAYNLSIDLAIKNNSPNNAVKCQLRFMIPRPANLGGAVYFPLPDSLGYIELPDEVTGSVTTGIHFDYPVYSSELVRQYGAQLQINYRSYRLNAGVVGGLVNVITQLLTGSNRPQLIDATMNMYST